MVALIIAPSAAPVSESDRPSQSPFHVVASLLTGLPGIEHVALEGLSTTTTTIRHQLMKVKVGKLPTFKSLGGHTQLCALPNGLLQKRLLCRHDFAVRF